MPRNSKLEEMTQVIQSQDDGEFLTGGHPIKEVAREWLDAGISPEQAKSYINSASWSPSRVAKLISARISPEQLQDPDVFSQVVKERDWKSRQRGGYGWAAQDFSDGRLGYLHSNGDVSTEEISKAVRATSTGSHKSKRQLQREIDAVVGRRSR